MNKNIYIFVENFSGEKREEFFEKELPVFVNHFEKIIIVPLYGGNTKLVYNDPKIEIRQFDAFSECNRISIFSRYFGLISKIFLYELYKTQDKSFYLKNFKTLINSLILRINSAKKLQKEIESNTSDSVFYCYWFNQWVFILSIIKTWDSSLKIVSRVHGSDYKEEQTKRTLPFRYFQLSKVNYIFSVSEYAKKYLIDKFKVKSEKIIVSRLGLPNVSQLSPVCSDRLVIISCSSLIPLKRVNLIPEILKNITLPVEWRHFGAGSELEKLINQNTELPANVKATMMGHVENEKFIQYLGNNPVSFFINVSENEGIPVTLMEASSFGIPLIGTDVCGIPEIVTVETGTLISLNFSPKEVAGYIEYAHKSGEIYTYEYRKKVQEYCKKFFTAQSNYTQLAINLSELN